MPCPSLRGKSCFITGAASGIGRATALCAAERGARLFLTDINGSRLAQIVSELRARGAKVEAHAALDIAHRGDLNAFADEIQREHGTMDVLMNIAGISTWGTIDALEHRHWRSVIEVNLMGPIHVLEAFVPAMIRAGRGGHIVNVSSAAGLFGLPWHAAYSASKFGLRGISEVLRFDLEAHGIGVSLVCPGAVDTPLVGTVDIVGVDATTPRARALRRKFQRHSVTPEVAARCVVEGIERNRYLVFTSRDIQLVHWLQQKLPFAYTMIMRKLNRELATLKQEPTRADAAPQPAHV